MTESEILKIFSDTVEAVAHMHYQSPPLIHRDLKVENILLTPPSTYKLCDFGSTTTPLYASKIPTAVGEIKLLEEEVNRTTTLQYRAPELVDVWGRKGWDEKIDIWALGVLLYKLCYYTTPFEEQGPLAILNAQYVIPPFPAYSSSIKSLIGAMLHEKAESRPNIYRVHEMTCSLRGSGIKFENRYTSPTATAYTSQTPSVKPTGTGQASSTTPAPLFVTAAPAPPPQLPSIQPMRRGRPPRTTSTLESDAGGFGNSFSPSLNPPNASLSPLSAHSAPNGGGMFADLLPPSQSLSSASLSALAASSPKLDSSTTSLPTLPSGTTHASRTGPTSSVPSSTPPSYFGVNSLTGGSGGAPRASFVPTSSFGLAAAATMQSPSYTPTQLLPSSTPIATSSVAIPKVIPRELTGEPSEVGPPLPRRPRDKPSVAIQVKPELVSRASQTSPSLLEADASRGWGGRSMVNSNANGTGSGGYRLSLGGVALSGAGFAAASSSGPGTSASTSTPIDLLGDDIDNITLAPSTSTSFASQTPTSPSTFDYAATSKDSIKRISTSFDQRERFRPVKPASPGSPSVSSRVPFARGAQDSPARGEGSVLDRYPSLESDSSSIIKERETDKEWLPIIEKEDLSSDEDEEDEFTPKKRPSSTSTDLAGQIPTLSYSSPTLRLPHSVSTETTSSKLQSLVPSSTSTSFSTTQSSTTSILASTAALETLPSLQSRYSSASTASTDGGGRIDIGPALSSIQRFAPTSNPTPLPSIPSPTSGGRSSTGLTLHEPKPFSVKKSDAIGNLVSRFENNRSPSIGVGMAPLVKPKPVRLRTSSMDSNLVAGENRNVSNVEDFSRRFPGEEELEERIDDFVGAAVPAAVAQETTMEPVQRSYTLPSSTTATSSPSSSITQRAPVTPSSTLQPTPPTSFNRQPFKPVPPPKDLAGSSASRSSTPSKGVIAPQVEDEGEEERFQGVSNMKSRWETIGKGGQQKRDSVGPGKPPAVRKEWAVI